jgi:hypothetical protein
MKFKDLDRGMFRWHGLVYTKFCRTAAAVITSGKVVRFEAEEEIEKL